MDARVLHARVLQHTAAALRQGDAPAWGCDAATARVRHQTLLALPFDARLAATPPAPLPRLLRRTREQALAMLTERARDDTLGRAAAGDELAMLLESGAGEAELERYMKARLLLAGLGGLPRERGCNDGVAVDAAAAAQAPSSAAAAPPASAMPAPLAALLARTLAATMRAHATAATAAATAAAAAAAATAGAAAPSDAPAIDTEWVAPARSGCHVGGTLAAIATLHSSRELISAWVRLQEDTR